MYMETAEISVAEEASTAMEMRGITEEDVRKVIAWAEGDGGKLIDEDGRFLGKKRMDNVTVYTLYTVADNVVFVSGAYSHRVLLLEDGEGGV